MLEYFRENLGKIEIVGSAKRIERVYFNIKHSRCGNVISIRQDRSVRNLLNYKLPEEFVVDKCAYFLFIVFIQLARTHGPNKDHTNRWNKTTQDTVNMTLSTAAWCSSKFHVDRFIKCTGSGSQRMTSGHLRCSPPQDEVNYSIREAVYKIVCVKFSFVHGQVCLSFK